MKMSEFYEKYYRIHLPNGETITPTLSDEERRVWDKAEEMDVEPYMMVKTRRGGTQIFVNPKVEEALKKLHHEEFKKDKK